MDTAENQTQCWNTPKTQWMLVTLFLGHSMDLVRYVTTEEVAHLFPFLTCVFPLTRDLEIKRLVLREEEDLLGMLSRIFVTLDLPLRLLSLIVLATLL